MGKFLKWSAPLLTVALSACVTSKPADPEALMHSHLLSPPELATHERVRPLISNPMLNSHTVDWGRFKKTARTPQPLKGLRVALDPGHIGGAPWDERNGKFIFNSHAERLSEGSMAFTLALLLEKELQALGAEVMIDRDGLKPVTAYSYDDFKDSPAVFFQTLDLDARAERIWAFHPDLVLILHFDSHLGGDLNVDHAKKLCNDTKAYVPGAFAEKELEEEVDRSFFSILWSNPEVWKDSVALSREIVTTVHTELGVPLSTDGYIHAQEIEPGVFSRNLHLQRRLAGLVSSFVEALCYEDPGEFKALAQADHNLKRAGQIYPYSPRLLALAQSLKRAVVSFVEARALTSPSEKPMQPQHDEKSVPSP